MVTSVDPGSISVDGPLKPPCVTPVHRIQNNHLRTAWCSSTAPLNKSETKEVPLGMLSARSPVSSASGHEFDPWNYHFLHDLYSTVLGDHQYHNAKYDFCDCQV